jgi:hypothetical protein
MALANSALDLVCYFVGWCAVLWHVRSLSTWPVVKYAVKTATSVPGTEVCGMIGRNRIHA